MEPLEAYKIISIAFEELSAARRFIFSKSKGYSQEEITAQVIAFEALRRMQEDEQKKGVTKDA